VIRIAFIVHGMQPGGIERSVTRIINGLDRNYFEPIVVCLDRSGPAAHWLEDDIPVIEIGKRPGNDLMSIGRLAAALRRYKVDLVQSHNWGTLIETVAARKLARVPAHIHAERGTVLGAVESGGFRDQLRSIAMKLALSTVDRMMSNSHAVAACVQKRCGYSAERITVIPNGIDGPTTDNRQQVRQQIRKRLRIEDDAVLLGSVGRLHEVKGFDVLVKAMSIVQSHRGPVHLVLVGDGDQREYLEELAEQEKVADRIHLVGYHDDVAPWLSAMDGYVNSSRSEGMSQSMLEAMSTGLPIVATNVGDACRMIRRENFVCGEICPADDVAALAESIDALLGDESTFRQYGIAAMNCHRQFYSALSINDSMQTLYLQTLSSKESISKRHSIATSVSSSIDEAASNRLIEKAGGGR